MPAPINYMAMMPERPDLASRFARGFKVGEMLGEGVKEDQYKADMLDAFNNPTSEKFVQLQLKYPDKATGIKSAWDTMDETKRAGEFKGGLEIANAIESGAPDVAMKKLEERIAAGKTSGGDVTIYEQMLGHLKEGNPKNALFTANLALSSADPKKFEAYYSARKAQAEAEKTGTEAEYGKRQQEADLAKKAADLGLTKAQTNKTLVETNKLGKETQKAALELEALKATGGIDPEKRFNQENTIRTQYQTRAANYGKVRDAYSTIEASANDQTGAGDIALVTSFMKMLDPGSVVRETEFANAQNTAGLLEKLKNQAEKLQTGAFLDPSQRKSFTDLAKKYLDAANEREGQIRKQYEKTVKTYNLDYENVFGVPPPDQKKPPAPLPGTEKPGAPSAPAQKPIVVDY